MKSERPRRFARMMAEAIAKDLISPGRPLKKLKANPHVITALSDYITEVEKLLQLPLIVHDIAAIHLLRRARNTSVKAAINFFRNRIAEYGTLELSFVAVGG